MNHMYIDHNQHPSDKTSWILGFIYLAARIMEENTFFSETLHFVFSVAGALVIVTLSHYWKKYLNSRSKNG